MTTTSDLTAKLDKFQAFAEAVADAHPDGDAVEGGNTQGTVEDIAEMWRNTEALVAAIRAVLALCDVVDGRMMATAKTDEIRAVLAEHLGGDR